MPFNQIVSDRKNRYLYITLLSKTLKNLHRNAAFFAFLHILCEIKFNLMKAEKYLKTVF